MFKNLTPTEAGRLDSVLHNAIIEADLVGNAMCGDDALDLLLELRDQHRQVDPETLGFRLTDA
jgi:hypothetical protein